MLKLQAARLEVLTAHSNAGEDSSLLGHDTVLLGSFSRLEGLWCCHLHSPAVQEDYFILKMKPPQTFQTSEADTTECLTHHHLPEDINLQVNATLQFFLSHTS